MPAPDTKDMTPDIKTEVQRDAERGEARVESGVDIITSEQFEQALLESGRAESDSISSETDDLAKRFMDNGGTEADRASLDEFSTRASDALAEFKIDLNTAKLPLMTMEQQVKEAQAANAEAMPVADKPSAAPRAEAAAVTREEKKTTSLELGKTMIDKTKPVELNPHVAADLATNAVEAMPGIVYDRAAEPRPEPTETQPTPVEPPIKEAPLPPRRAVEAAPVEEKTPSPAEQRAERMGKLNAYESKLQADYAKALEALNKDLLAGKFGRTSAGDRFNDTILKLNSVKAAKKNLLEQGAAANFAAIDAALGEPTPAKGNTAEFFAPLREEMAAKPPEEPVRDFMPAGDDELGSALRPVRAELGIKPVMKATDKRAFTESMGDADEAAEAVVLPEDSEALAQQLVEDHAADPLAETSYIPTDSDKLVDDLLAEQGLKPLSTENPPAPTEIKDEHEEPWMFPQEMTDELVRLSTKAEAKLAPLAEIEAMVEGTDKEKLLDGRLTPESLEAEAEYARTFANMAERVLAAIPADNAERVVWAEVAKKNTTRLKDLNQRIKELSKGEAGVDDQNNEYVKVGDDELITDEAKPAETAADLAAATEKDEIKEQLKDFEFNDLPGDVEAELGRLTETEESEWQTLDEVEAMPDSASKDELLKARLAPESLGREADYMQQVVDLDNRMMSAMDEGERDKYLRSMALENALRLAKLNRRIKSLPDASERPSA